MYEDVYVYLIDRLPPKTHEMVCPNPDGTYTVLIDAKLSYSMQMESFNHAMKHIQNGDFEKCDVQEIEANAHGIEGKDFVETIKRKVRRSSPRINFLKKHGYDFFGAAERKWLEPEG